MPDNASDLAQKYGYDPSAVATLARVLKGGQPTEWARNNPIGAQFLAGILKYIPAAIGIRGASGPLPIASIASKLGAAEMPRIAAFRVGDQVFQHPIHAGAIEAAENALGHDAVWKNWNQQTGFDPSMEGYVTNEGRFVTRDEATELMKNQGLYRDPAVPGYKGQLHSSELRYLQGNGD